MSSFVSLVSLALADNETLSPTGVDVQVDMLTEL